MSDHPHFYHSPTEVITGFYTLVNNKKYEEAFNCLTPEFRGNAYWKNDPQIFASGYQHTVSVKIIGIIPFKENPNSSEYVVAYLDEVNALQHPLLTAIKEAEFKDLELFKKDTEQKESEDPGLFKKNIAEFSDFLITELSGNPEEIANIRLKHIFKGDAVGICLFLSGADQSNVDEIFTRSPTVTADFRRAICVPDEETGWKIAGLRYI